MNIKIHRGQNQIGGNIVEIFTDSTRVLLDVGAELNDDEIPTLPQIDGLFDNAAYDAVFISHYHGDHLGLAYYIDKRIPTPTPNTQKPSEFVIRLIPSTLTALSLYPESFNLLINCAPTAKPPIKDNSR